MFKNLFANLQKVGKALMLPVSVLPVAGILLGVGAAHLSFIPEIVSNLMEQAGGSVFGQMALLFAVGVALGFTNNDGVAGLAAIVGYGIMTATLGVMAGVMGVEKNRYRCTRWYPCRWCCCLGIQPFLQNSTSRIPWLLCW